MSLDPSPAPPSADTNEPFNRIQILEAESLNVPKLKELNYTQWKLTLSDAIKTAELWGYVDGSVTRPSPANVDDYRKYTRESGAVRKAIVDALELGAHKYLEGTLTARDAWMALDQRYQSGGGADLVSVERHQHYQSGDDADLASIERKLAELKLPEGGDVIEHVANFCRLRRLLAGTRFALDDHASFGMMYRSLPAGYRQWLLEQSQYENEGFESICAARLDARYQSMKLHQAEPVTSSARATDHPPELASIDYSEWGVPDDIRAFDLTGEKNPLLADRAIVTCRDCLLKDHKAGTPECPQYAWRRELWGEPTQGESTAQPQSADPDALGSNAIGSENAAVVADADNPNSTTSTYSKRGETICIRNEDRTSVYELSEEVEISWDFGWLGLKKELLHRIRECGLKKPSEIQQCAITPIINGRNVFAQAQHGSGKTLALAISILQSVRADLLETQALVLTPTEQLALRVVSLITALGRDLHVRAHECTSSTHRGVTLQKLAVDRGVHVILGTPDQIVDLIRRGILHTHSIKLLALDGADELIDKGFQDQIIDIHRSLPRTIQVVALHTTLSYELQESIQKLMVDPLRINVKRDESLPKSTKHFFVDMSVNGSGNTCVVETGNRRDDQRFLALDGLVSRSIFRRVVVFCNSSHAVEYFVGHLNGAIFVHDQMKQEEQEAALQTICAVDHEYGMLITDNWRRGFCPHRTSVVVNHDLPDTPEDYATRLGHPSGFGSKDIVINFVRYDGDRGILQAIERFYDIQIAQIQFAEMGVL